MPSSSGDDSGTIEGIPAEVRDRNRLERKKQKWLDDVFTSMLQAAGTSPGRKVQANDDVNCPINPRNFSYSLLRLVVPLVRNQEKGGSRHRCTRKPRHLSSKR